MVPEMSSIRELSDLLKRMSELAFIGKSPRVGETLERISKLILYDTESGVSAILNLYGGMGSINDVVFYDEMTPLIKENNEFSELRTKLFDMTYDIRKNL